MKVGNNVSFDQMCYIQGSSTFTVGSDVEIAYGVTIETESHGFSDETICISNQSMIYVEDVIDNNVWIGEKVTILSGIHIGNETIVGTNAVVMKSVD